MRPFLSQAAVIFFFGYYLFICRGLTLLACMQMPVCVNAGIGLQAVLVWLI